MNAVDNEPKDVMKRFERLVWILAWLFALQAVQGVFVYTAQKQYQDALYWALSGMASLCLAPLIVHLFGKALQKNDDKADHD